MSDFFERIQGLSPKRLALLAVELNDALEAERSRGREPIAVVGIGCRFPGAPNPAAYWRLLSEGREAIRDVPADRWDVNAWYDPDPDAPGKISARAGGFLDKVDGFEPERSARQLAGIVNPLARLGQPQSSAELQHPFRGGEIGLRQQRQRKEEKQETHYP